MIDRELIDRIEAFVNGYSGILNRTIAKDWLFHFSKAYAATLKSEQVDELNLRDGNAIKREHRMNQEDDKIEDEISFVASDESNHHDWNDLRFKAEWQEGFVAGAKWMRNKAAPSNEGGLIPKEIHLALETARLEIESLNKRCGYLDSGALIQIRAIFDKYKL